VDVVIEHGNNSYTTFHFRIADMTGQEGPLGWRAMETMNADMFLVVFSLINMQTLGYADDLLQFLERSPPWNSSDYPRRHIPFILVGSKSDMKDQRKVSVADAEQIAGKHQGKFMECSALTGEGIAEIFQELTRLWYDLNPELAHYKHRRRSTIHEQEPGEGGCCSVA
jgi:GTPase SAR1 family protein